MGRRDPSFVTPLIKRLLIIRNRERRRGSIVTGNNLAGKINGPITNVSSKQYPDLTNANTRELWEAVKGKTKKLDLRDRYSNILSSPDLVNQVFAYVATGNC